jgi:hypothetical protein
MILPRYYIVGDRPVKMLKTTDGGMGVYAYNWETGEFILEMKYLFRLLKASSHEVEQVTEQQFDDQVQKLRSRLKERK